MNIPPHSDCDPQYGFAAKVDGVWMVKFHCSRHGYLNVEIHEQYYYEQQALVVSDLIARHRVEALETFR